MSLRILWTEDELIVVLDLYFKLPFGKLHRNNPEVKALARLIGRTDNSVALRLANFAACDPYILESGRHGMPQGRDRCLPIWDLYADNKEALFLKAQEIRARLAHKTIEQSLSLKPEDFIGREREAVIRTRVNQTAFRNMILNNYESRCALTGIDIPELLVASHIKPWAVDETNRLNPSNGICLSPLYDKMFDKGLIGIRDDYSVQISYELKSHSDRDYYNHHIGIIEDRKLTMPIEHLPAPEFIEYHYTHIFLPHN